MPAGKICSKNSSLKSMLAQELLAGSSTWSAAASSCTNQKSSWLIWMSLLTLVSLSSAWSQKRWASPSSSTGLTLEIHTDRQESSTKACTFSLCSHATTSSSCQLYSSAQRNKWVTSTMHVPMRLIRQFREWMNRFNNKVMRKWLSKLRTSWDYRKSCWRGLQTCRVKLRWEKFSRIISRCYQNLQNLSQRWDTEWNIEISCYKDW